MYARTKSELITKITNGNHFEYSTDHIYRHMRYTQIVY